MLWNIASCYACFKEQGHLWNLIYGYWLLSSDFCKTSWIFLHDPACPKIGRILSKTLVRSVLKPGPFCPGTWSVLSLDVVRFVLERGPFCLVRFVHGPFCPSTISRHEETFAVSIQKNSTITMHKFRVKSICYLFCGKF